MKTFRTILLTVVVTIGVLVFGLFRFGVLNTKANVETHNYQLYCDGVMVDTYSTETFNGVDVNMAINQNYHIGR